jgi:hypothetical protein
MDRPASLLASAFLTCVVIAWPGSAAAQTGSGVPASRWTVSADAVVDQRDGTAPRTLVERLPGTTPFNAVPSTPGAPALNSTDLVQALKTGVRASVRYRLDSITGLDAAILRTGTWSATRRVGPDAPLTWLVMRAPGTFWQTQDFSYQAMQWDDTTRLRGAEVGLHRALNRRLTLLGGARWLELRDHLEGSIPPPDLLLPTWKFAPASTLVDVALFETQPGGTPSTGTFPPFWTANTRNSLYGLQAGVAGTALARGRVSVDGQAMIGAYANHAMQDTGVSLAKVVRTAGASTHRAAFTADLGVHAAVRLSARLSLRLGYDALVVHGVALAPGQIDETATSGLTAVTALGINASSHIVVHGAVAGMRVSF